MFSENHIHNRMLSSGIHLCVYALHEQAPAPWQRAPANKWTTLRKNDYSAEYYDTKQKWAPMSFISANIGIDIHIVVMGRSRHIYLWLVPVRFLLNNAVVWLGARLADVPHDTCSTKKLISSDLLWGGDKITKSLQNHKKSTSPNGSWFHKNQSIDFAQRLSIDRNHSVTKSLTTWTSYQRTIVNYWNVLCFKTDG